MSKVSFFQQTFVVLFALLLVAQSEAYFPQYFGKDQDDDLSSVLSLYRNMPVPSRRPSYLVIMMSRYCSTNTPCMWASCTWSEYVQVNSESCNFLASGCLCPPGTSCQRTSLVTPVNGYLRVDFTCQYI